MATISTNLTIQEKCVQIANIEGLKKRFPVLPEGDTYTVKTSWNKPLAIAAVILGTLAAYLIRQAQFYLAIGCGFTAVLICTQIFTQETIRKTSADAIEEQSREIDKLFSGVIEELNKQTEILSQMISDKVNEASCTDFTKAEAFSEQLLQRYLLSDNYDQIDPSQHAKIDSLRKFASVIKPLADFEFVRYTNDSNLNVHLYRELVKVYMASQRFLHGNESSFESEDNYVHNQLGAQSNTVVSEPWPESVTHLQETPSTNKQSKNRSSLYSIVTEQQKKEIEKISKWISEKVNESNLTDLNEAKELVETLLSKYESDSIEMLGLFAKLESEYDLELDAYDSTLNDGVYREFVKFCIAAHQLLHGPKISHGFVGSYVDNKIVTENGAEKVVSKPWPAPSSNPSEESDRNRAETVK